MKRANQIRSLLSVVVLFGLLGAWGGQVAHLILVPHHYCLEHDEISHEAEHVGLHQGNAWEVAQADGEDHCSILGNFLRSGVLTPSFAVNDKTFVPNEHVSELVSFSLFTSNLFLLAPKNSPPRT